MKKILAILCLIGIFSTGNAQYYRRDGGFLLGVNAGYTYPLGDFGKVAKNGMGGNLSAKYLINRVIGIGLETGYHSFKQGGELEKQSQTQTHTTKYKLIPVVLEATFYIPTWDRSILPYCGLHFGAYALNFSVDQKDQYNPGKNVNTSVWQFMPGVGVDIGVLFELSENISLDVKIRGDYIPKIESKYTYQDTENGVDNTGYFGFDKMLNLGANIGLLYKF